MNVVVAVMPLLPVKPITRMLNNGWHANRSNGHTVTLSREFFDLSAAKQAGSGLPAGTVWAIEEIE